MDWSNFKIRKERDYKGQPKGWQPRGGKWLIGLESRFRDIIREAEAKGFQKVFRCRMEYEDILNKGAEHLLYLNKDKSMGFIVTKLYDTKANALRQIRPTPPTPIANLNGLEVWEMYKEYVAVKQARERIEPAKDLCSTFIDPLAYLGIRGPNQDGS